MKLFVIAQTKLDKITIPNPAKSTFFESLESILLPSNICMMATINMKPPTVTLIQNKDT